MFMNPDLVSSLLNNHKVYNYTALLSMLIRSSHMYLGRELREYARRNYNQGLGFKGVMVQGTYGRTAVYP